jgi:hypothetical protein
MLADSLQTDPDPPFWMIYFLLSLIYIWWRRKESETDERAVDKKRNEAKSATQLMTSAHSLKALHRVPATQPSSTRHKLQELDSYKYATMYVAIPPNRERPI